MRYPKPAWGWAFATERSVGVSVRGRHGPATVQGQDAAKAGRWQPSDGPRELR
jgi:hypothetical protein